jgi:hypothetical protein
MVTIYRRRGLISSGRAWMLTPSGGWAGWMVTICCHTSFISSGRAWMLTIRWLGRLDGDHLQPQRPHQQRKGLDADHPEAGWMVTICHTSLISSGRAWMLTIRWLGRLDGDHLPPQRLHQQRKGLDVDHPEAGQAGW